MVRRALVIVGLVCACSRENPAFDDERIQADDGAPSSSTGAMVDDGPDDSRTDGPGGVPDVGDAAMTDDSVSPGDSSDGAQDTGEPACGFALTQGLTITFGQPEGGNSCPSTYTIWTMLTEASGGTGTFSVCTEGCVGCQFQEFPLGIAPLAVAEHVPLRTCLRLETVHLVGVVGGTCEYGALTIYDALSSTPYLVATSRGYPPTDVGTELLAEVLPEPVKAAACGCDAFEHADQCCYTGPPPEQWYYPWENGGIYPGEGVPLSLPGWDATYELAVFQAQRITTCDDGDDLQTSWAVTAEL